MGKTRLAEEFLAWARRQGIGTAIARCYASQQDLAYGPVADWLRSEPLQAALGNLERPWLSEIARLLPELLIDRPDVPAPGPLAESWQCQHLFEALARPFGDHDRLVLLADDLHWADGETLEWLTYLLRSATGQRRTAALLVVATVRSEEMPDRQGVQRVLDDLRHYGQLGEIPLGPLSERESLALATNVAGRPLTPDLAAGLYRETEGNPLFIVEMVRAAILEPAGSKGKDAAPGASGTLPPAIQAAIAARLAYLSAAARDLARVAAVIGREFSVEVLARSAAPEGGSGDEEDVVAALDELWQRRIVRRHGGGPSDTAYDFSHEKIRQVIYDEISPARRRYLHSRVASALEAVHGHDLDIMSGEIAAHYERGGRYQEAIAHYRRAADVARRIYANERAIGYYRHLLEGDLAALLSAEETCAVMLDLGRVWQLTGDWPAAEEIYRSALVRAEAAGGGALVARCQHRLGDLVRLRGEYDDALAWLALARDGFEAAGERRGLVGVLWTMGEVYWYQGDPERALATLQRQMEIASEIGNRRAVCDAAGTLGNVYWSLGDLARSRRYCRQSLDLAQEIDHWWAVGRALVTLGQTYAQEGNLEQAFICYDQALEAATQVGDRPCRGRAATAMGDLYGRAGQAGAARACYGYGLMDRLEMGDRRAAAASLAHMAELYARQGDVVRAEALKRRGQTLAQPAEGHGGEGYPPDFAQFDGENGLSSRAATGPAPAIPPVLPDLPAAVRQAAIDIGELLARVDRLLAGPQEE
jgi:tetratricopeptide (TPR) repeat protein